MINNEEKRDGV